MEIIRYIDNYKSLKKIFFFFFQSSVCLGRFFLWVGVNWRESASSVKIVFWEPLKSTMYCFSLFFTRKVLSFFQISRAESELWISPAYSSSLSLGIRYWNINGHTVKIAPDSKILWASHSWASCFISPISRISQRT